MATVSKVGRLDNNRPEVALVEVDLTKVLPVKVVGCMEDDFVGGGIHAERRQGAN
jgi:hypothetical protein